MIKYNKKNEIKKTIGIIILKKYFATNPKFGDIHSGDKYSKLKFVIDNKSKIVATVEGHTVGNDYVLKI